MKRLYRYLGIATLCALMSTPAVLAQEDRQYDPQTDDQYSQQDQYNSQDQNNQYNDQQAEATPPAQYPQDNDRQPDPPTRAARLQYMSGSVSVQPHGTDEWVAGALNRPLTISDNIWADKNSRAEISVGTGLIRIDSESSLTLTNVTDNMVQLQLHQGAMYLHVRRLYDGETYEVDTPDQAFTVRKPGDYRFDVDSDNDKTIITVWRGEGESTGNGPTVRLREGQQALFNGTDLNAVQIHRAPNADGFDEWAQARDHRYDRSTSARYVSPDVVGYEDLDEYGSWRNTPDYGDVWVPSQVSVGWAPYRYGHWIWVSPWGWTWVEDEPWGYAPFHYGRWVYYDNYWGWAPGPIWVRPYYAPALVAWFGGGGWGVGFGFGGGYGYGWCPLGFGEPYVPWYHVSRGYFNQVNITNTRITNVNITNIYNNTYINKGGRGGHGGGGGGAYGPHPGNQIHYANLRHPGGFTATSRDTILNSRNVANNVVKVSPTQINKITVNNNITNKINVDARPTKTAMLGPNAGRQTAVPPQRAFAKPVVSHAAPPAGFNRGANRAENNAGFNRGRDNVGANRGPVNNNGNLNRGPATLGDNQRGQSDARRSQIPGPSMSNQRGGPNSNMRLPEAQQRSVPRPPSADGERGMNAGPGARNDNPRSNAQMPGARPDSRPAVNEGRAPEMQQRGSVPHPPAASMPRGEGRGMERSAPAPRGDAGNGRGMERNAPAPAPRGMERQSAPSPAPRGADRPSAPERGNSGPHAQMSVPRPPNANMGGNPVDRGGFGGNARTSTPRPDPTFEAHNNRPTFGGGNSRPAPSYDRGPSRPAPAPSYDRGSMGRSMPSYGGGMNRPAPSYGGGPSARSMPSYGGGRAPSYGGGGFGGGHAPSYGGGGGHASMPSGGHGGGGFGGGGHVSGGGGGHASAPSGGGHSSGGSSSHNGGGHHGH